MKLGQKRVRPDEPGKITGYPGRWQCAVGGRLINILQVSIRNLHRDPSAKKYITFRIRIRVATFWKSLMDILVHMLLLNKKQLLPCNLKLRSHIPPESTWCRAYSNNQTDVINNAKTYEIMCMKISEEKWLGRRGIRRGASVSRAARQGGIFFILAIIPVKKQAPINDNFDKFQYFSTTVVSC